MDILVLGWEFPPHSIGGLGTHTYELVKALKKLGASVTLILPFSYHEKIEGVKFLTAPVYKPSSVYHTQRNESELDIYSGLKQEVDSYTKNAVLIGKNEKFDIINANDWLTAEAGLELKRLTGKPLVLTMHSTEYDRTNNRPWEPIVKEEASAVNNADMVIAVSERLKSEIVQKYGVDPKKVTVIYNAIDASKFKNNGVNKNSEIILYAGRLSVQKGIDHLLRAFKIVSERDKNAVLFIAGEGSEIKPLIDLSIDLGINGRVKFLGRVSDEDLEKLYSVARVFVMPSVSEPFGITALEAVASRTPTIVSKQSGVSEILKNVFKIDFWDSQQMADMILGLLKYPMVDELISSEAYKEISKLTWENAAKKFLETYKKLL